MAEVTWRRRGRRALLGLLWLLAIVFVLCSQLERGSPSRRTGEGDLFGSSPAVRWLLIELSWKGALVVTAAGLLASAVLATQLRPRLRLLLTTLVPYAAIVVVALLSWPNATDYEGANGGISAADYTHYLRRPWPLAPASAASVERSVTRFRHSDRFAAAHLLFVGTARPYDPLAVWRVVTPILTRRYGGFSMQNESQDWIWVARRAGWTEVFVFATVVQARRNEPAPKPCAWHRRLGNIIVRASACTPDGFTPTPGLSLAALLPAAKEIAAALETAGVAGRLRR